MAERIVDAAVSDGVNAANFFLADQHVVYDYVQDRVKDGVHPLTSFAPGAASGFPASFAPPEPSTIMEAALRGKGPYSGFIYFFRGPQYMRYRTALPAPRFDPNHARELSLWNLPAPFTSVDAAFNGALNREAYCYFFKGNKYVRYTWATDAVDAGYPKPISNMVGMPASFAAGVDAAVDGAGPFADASYLFKGDEYLRFQWVATGEPRVVGGVKPIQGNWPGLAEMLLAGKAKSHALVWLRVTRERLAALQGGTLSGAHLPTMIAALNTHFHILPTDTGRLNTISNMFRLVEKTLRDSARTFRFRTDAESTADGVPNIPAAYTWPLPQGAATRINITRNFKKRKELNRVSSLIHEAVHVNDPGATGRAIHISEWYVSPHLAPALGLTPHFADDPAFATRYDLMTASNAVHNPSSYATFARHIFMGFDQREFPS